MIYEILEQLASTTKRKEKEAILSKQKDNMLLKETFRLALNPYINYYIKKIPSYNTLTIPKYSLNDAFGLLGKLSSREKTGHAAIDHLTSLLEGLPKNDAIVLERVIKQDLRCGIQDSTVNKIWKDWIPVYPCLLGEPYSVELFNKFNLPAYAQIKADGVRFNAHVTEYSVEICGRSGKEIDLLGNLKEEFVALRKFCPTDMVFDGELIVLEEDGTVMPRKKGNGIINKAIKGTISNEEAARVRAVIWDMIPKENFDEHVYNVSYTKRYNKLKEYLSEFDKVYYDNPEESFLNVLKGSDKKKITLIETRVVSSVEEVDEFYAEAVARGEEGIMLKDMSVIWDDSRSKLILKLKAEHDCDLVIVGFNWGTEGTKNEFKVGSIICESCDGKVNVSISGMSDDERDDVTLNFEEKYKGKIVTVTYNEKISSKEKGREGIFSLFLPRIQEFRQDKVTADHSDKIK